MSLSKLSLPAFLDIKNLYPSPIPPDQVTNPSQWFFPVTQLAFMSSTMLPRSARIKIAAPLLLVLVSRTRSVNTGDIKDFLRMIHVCGLGLKFVDFGMLVEDGAEFKIVKVQNEDEEVEVRKRGAGNGGDIRGVWGKVRESIELWFFTNRGVGWNWEVGGIPDCPDESKQTFLLRTIFRLLGTILAWDFCRFTLSCFPYILTTPRGLFFELPIYQQVILTWLHQLEAFCFINTPYQLLALLTVLISYQAPTDWPPLFGDIREGYLVSKAWGRVWHQLLRRQFGILTPYGQSVAAKIGVWGKGRAGRRWVSLGCSFFMSGLYHWSGVVNRPWTGRSSGMFWYFVMQVPAIRGEDLVVEWGQGRGVKGSRWLKTLGYIWTVAWISFSMRYAAAWQYESGALSEHKPFILSGIGLVGKLLSR